MLPNVFVSSIISESAMSSRYYFMANVNVDIPVGTYNMGFEKPLLRQKHHLIFAKLKAKL